MAPLSSSSKWPFGPWCIGRKKNLWQALRHEWVVLVASRLQCSVLTKRWTYNSGHAGVHCCVWGAKASLSCPIPQKSSCNCNTNHRKKVSTDRLSAAWWLKCCIVPLLSLLHILTSHHQCGTVQSQHYGGPKGSSFSMRKCRAIFYWWSQRCDDI